MGRQPPARDLVGRRRSAAPGHKDGALARVRRVHGARDRPRLGSRALARGARAALASRGRGRERRRVRRGDGLMQLTMQTGQLPKETPETAFGAGAPEQDPMRNFGYTVAAYSVLWCILL